MTPDDRLAMDEAMLDCLDAHNDAILIALTANDDVLVAHEMTSTLLALLHAQQLETAEWRRRYELAAADCRRYSRMVLP